MDKYISHIMTTAHLMVLKFQLLVVWLVVGALLLCVFPGTGKHIQKY
jgi:hypothetical protein